MGDHHAGDPFYAPPNPNPRRAGPPVAAAPAPAPQPPGAPTPPAGAPMPTVEKSLAAVPEPAPAAVPTVTPHPPQDEPHQASPPPTVNRSQLQGMRLDDLQKLAIAFGIDNTGKRPVLIARIKNHLDQTRASS